MTRRARLLSVLAILVAGATGVIGSTQTWLEVTLADGAAEPLAVPGASAIPVLTPLSLAALALGVALSIIGPILRYVFGALAVAIGVVLGFLTAQVAFSTPIAAVASTVTAATGIAGADAVADLVASISATPWPAIALAGSALLVAAGVLTLVTARRWRGSGERRYRAASGSTPTGSRPHDAIDSWDDLSRGDDPTA